jgi:hypothetical protein
MRKLMVMALLVGTMMAVIPNPLPPTPRPNPKPEPPKPCSVNNPSRCIPNLPPIPGPKA